ncbi:MAG: hypothetical protein EBR82_26255 [Caulobacteraceae bacterium]|nr:hypothetical protein [Caulobacteraceae bacterium]
MAIDKIVLEFQAETTRLRKELDDLKSRLGDVETAAKDAGKNTGKALDDVGKNANGLKDTIKNLGQQIAAAFAAREIIRFTKQTIDAASDLNETLDKSRIIFGQASTAVENFASNSAKQFGMSRKEAIDAAASFGVFGKSAGKTGQDLASFSTDLVGLSADLASFNNTSPEEAALALGAALRGEAEPIRRFGVLLDDATLKQEALALGLIKTTKEALTPQNKVLAANSAIFKQTTDAQGNFILTSGGVANQQRILEATFKDLQTEVGQKLLPTFNAALKGLNEFLGDLDAEDVLSFAKAIGFAATAFGAFKLGNIIKDMGGLTGVLKGVTGGVHGLNKAVMSNPFGLIASAVSLLIAYGPDLIDMFSGVTELQKELQQVSSEATENLRKEQGELNLVAEALAKTNPGSEERTRLLKRFNELSPTAIKDLQDEAKFNTQLKSALDTANQSFTQRIKLRAAEAVAQAASQKQIEAEAKAIEQSTEILMQNGAVNQKVLNQFRKEIEAGNVRTGFFGNIPEVFRRIGLEMGFSRNEAAKLFLQASNNIDAFDGYAESIKLSAEAGKELSNIEKTLAQSSAQNVITRTKDEEQLMYLQAKKHYLKEKLTKAEEAELKKLTATTNTNTNADKENTKEKEKAKTAIEKVVAEIQKLTQEAETLASKGDYVGAEKAATAAGVLQGRLNHLKTSIEEYKKAAEDAMKPVEIVPEKPVTISNLSLTKVPEANVTVTLKKDEKSAEEIKQEIIEDVKEIQDEFNQISAAITSVTGPAFDALNSFFDANLQRLELEKNKRLSNEKLTAEERLKIEEEYEKKKNQIMAEQFEIGRAEQIINATMSAAQAALNAFASTAAIPIVGPGLASAAAAVAGAFGALQIGIIAAQPNPYKFYDGTPYLQLGDNPKGRDTIPVMAHEGEAIIPTRNNLQYPGLAQSWIDGNLDRYINNNFVRPALMEQQRQAEEDFADRLAASMALQMAANFDDYRLHRDLKEQTAVLRDGFHSMKITRKKLRGA